MTRTNTNWRVVNMFKDRANKINCKEHFNPKKFDLTIKKISRVRKTRNAAYNINYHFTWIPKTRAKILVEPFTSDIKKYLVEKSNEKKWDPLALQLMPDHVHFFISIPPKWAPCYVVQQLKAYSSKKIRKKYSIVRKFRTVYNEEKEIKLECKNFWASGYYCGVAGHVSAISVVRYINEQNNKIKNKWDRFDLKPFEYNILDERILSKNQKTLTSFTD